MADLHQFVRVSFHRFKSFSDFTLNLRRFNILVGPNNAGKSTILAAFRILAAAMRKANTRRPEIISGPNGQTYGYNIDLRGISVAEENIFYNYDDSDAAIITFQISNKNKLILYFPEQNVCYLIPETDGKPIRSPANFRSQYKCEIGFVPILGPVEHNETLYKKEAARLALFNYRAARNFRNIWYHYPEKFDEFRQTLRNTWPGMDIEPPVVEISDQDPRIHMFCPEERIPREIFWAGFGFQVWCQMLTHMIQSSDKAIFLIDEPDIYLHADLQRQLLGLLKNLGPDILIATHSTEIITEAEPDDIVTINKNRRHSRRIKNPGQISEVFSILGSNLNPILTQLAKTRHAVFVEGKDFQIISKFAQKLGFSGVSNRRDFAVVPVQGFNPERIRNLKAGMEFTLGGEISAAAVLDRDYRSTEEADTIRIQCEQFCHLAIVLKCKEIENFLLIPDAIDRAVARKVAEQERRTGTQLNYEACTEDLLEQFATERKSYITSRLLDSRQHFERQRGSSQANATVNEATLDDFEITWREKSTRLNALPGKEAVSFLNTHFQDCYGVSVTPTSIIEAMTSVDIPPDMKEMVKAISDFSSPSEGQAIHS